MVATQEVDGTGKVLAPGLIDIHTHYDPQLCWDGAARPCLEHGATTSRLSNVVLANW
jgi:N-acyl-D-aspartate/D-glutamate deacylase